MKKEDIPGLYLVFEGVDLAGKSSLAKELIQKLIEKYGADNIVHKREPSYTNNGKKMRDVLMSGEMTEEKEVLAAQLMLLDRIENTTEVSGLLRENKIVIQERNFLTALVYNEAADTPEVKLVQEANKYSLKPDFLVLINISDSVIQYRLDKGKEERGALDAYENYDKIIKRKKAYLQMDEYIDIIYSNDNLDSKEKIINSLMDIIDNNWKK